MDRHEASSQSALAARGPSARRLRIAAVLLVATIAAGAAVKFGASTPATAAATGEPVRTFRATGNGPVHFSGALDGTAVHASGDRNVRMELVLGADAARTGHAPRVPTDLVVVLDRSGSMSGDKIEHARAAVRTLIGALDANDRFALVTYSDGAAAPIPLGSRGDRSTWLSIVDSIQPDGGTNLSSGLDAAFAMIDGARSGGRAPRIVLISDGLANQGDASREGLVGRASRAARGEYTLSTVGVGADFDEGLMAALADAGTGNFHFLSSGSGLAAILAAEFATARETVATALRVAIEPAAGVEVIDAAGYPLIREARSVTFQPGDLFAGQERRIWVTLRVPAGASGVVPLGSFSLAYAANDARHLLAFTETPRVTAVAEEREYLASLDPKRWERGVVVDQYNALRRSVASAVKDGRERDALAEVQKYRQDVARKNQAVQSPEVAAQLEDAAKLEARMQDAVSGAAPVTPAEAKDLRAKGYAEGRPGSRK